MAVVREACFFGPVLDPGYTNKPDCEGAGGVWKPISGDVPGFVCVIDGKRRPGIKNKARCLRQGGEWIAVTMAPVRRKSTSGKGKKRPKKKPTP